MAAVDYFLKIDGIAGESTDADHKDEIMVESFSFGATQMGTHSGGGGGGSGKVTMQDFHFVLRSDKSSPLLMLSCATGEHIKDAVLTCRKAGEQGSFPGVPVEFLKIKLSDCLISSLQMNLPTLVGLLAPPTADGTARVVGEPVPDIVPMDQISLNFSKVEILYTPITARGPGQPVRATWDLKTNKSF